MLKIQNLTAKIDEKIILNNINLEIPSGQVVVLTGHNGSGKSSLAQIIAGNKDYFCSSNSEVFFKDKNLIDLEPHQISNLGVFVSFQNPVEVPNVSLLSYLKLISDQNRINNRIDKLSAKEFMISIRQNLSLLGWDESWLKRNLNEGMSGGEKKKCEILQMLTLDPELIILDEIDSGLDSKSLESIGKIIQGLKNKTVIIITHNQKILEYLKIDQEFELIKGEIAYTKSK
jgi:Fe-S cluster assembly ATP-binding protein